MIGAIRGRKQAALPPLPPACDCCERTAELERVVVSLCRLFNSRTGGMPGVPGLISDANRVNQFAGRPQ